MTKEIIYYGHRLRDDDPRVQADNLKRARQRMRALQRELGPRAVVWAPWMVLAEGEVRESVASYVIRYAIHASHRVVLDLDGQDWTEGLRGERYVADYYDRPCEVRP